MTRAGAALVALSALAASACADATGGSDLDAEVPFDGAALGPCATNDYRAIPVASCPATGCIGSLAFAICEGDLYRRCACAPPGGNYVLVEAGATDAARDAPGGS